MQVLDASAIEGIRGLVGESSSIYSCIQIYKALNPPGPPSVSRIEIEEGGRVWDPKMCAPKRARSDFPNYKFGFSRDGHFGWLGGGVLLRLSAVLMSARSRPLTGLASRQTSSQPPLHVGDGRRHPRARAHTRPSGGRGQGTGHTSPRPLWHASVPRALSCGSPESQKWRMKGDSGRSSDGGIGTDAWAGVHQKGRDLRGGPRGG